MEFGKWCLEPCGCKENREKATELEQPRGEELPDEVSSADLCGPHTRTRPVPISELEAEGSPRDPNPAAEVLPPEGVDGGETNVTVSVIFEHPRNKSRIEKHFVRRPLGLDFEHTAPVTVMHVRPGLHGAELEVKSDWVVCTVNGTKLPGVDFDADFKFLSDAVERLPVVKSWSLNADPSERNESSPVPQSEFPSAQATYNPCIDV